MFKENMGTNYYAIIPASVRYDKNITPNAKLLYGEITALCNEKGYCWATNEYFASLYGTSTRSITSWISQLLNNGHISVEFIYKGNKEIESRRIYISETYGKKLPEGVEEIFYTPRNNFLEGVEEIFQDNNTVNNTNEYNENNEQSKFVIPSFEEVNQYCIERNNNIDAQQFIDFYESKGWMVGKNKMKDWKACIRTWERNHSVNKQISEIKNHIDWDNI